MNDNETFARLYQQALDAIQTAFGGQSNVLEVRYVAATKTMWVKTDTRYGSGWYSWSAGRFQPEPHEPVTQRR